MASTLSMPAASAFISTGLALLLAPVQTANLALGFMGFEAGVSGGLRLFLSQNCSFAALIHSGIGNVAAGSPFAILQSAGAGGYGMAIDPRIHLRFTILFFLPLFLFPPKLDSPIFENRPNYLNLIMAVPILNSGGDNHGDDDPQNHRSDNSDPYQIPLDDPIWGVRATRTLTLSGIMATFLAAGGYTVIPPSEPSSSHQPRNLAPAAHPEERLAPLQGPRRSPLNSMQGVSEHPAENGPQPDVAPLDEVQASVAEASNGETSKTKRKSKKKKWEKNKKQEKKKKQEQEQNVCRLFQESGQCRYGDNCKYSHQLPNTLPLPDGTVDPDLPEKEDGSSKKEYDSPIDLFFAKYPKFDYMRDKPLWNEFHRMVEHFKWQGAERGHFKSEFRDALVEEFNYVYGTDEGSLESWDKLCQAMGLSAPKTLKEAHKIVRGAHVNLVALVQSPRTGEPVEVFKSMQDLRQFTAKTKWTFPQEHDQAGGLLNMLIRKMSVPSHGRGSRGKKKVVAE
ncbi:uncharacterized protein NECHADRAFT_79369 [Fusarium vanettenii 77-13-4]|uniref:C3H1-type domain-containing protein n=1 Tax=Fusarium vanettenii (strain ATCC MYA-4622 / CBS 123669 / FGSC 9596 / NRRL 45880 / 77-13-4) TaxID=660122 RepID=C7YNN7_FUSV7|nr:uncharacterized protein NECHADRAFT_79369 [Fusarium vanettenii 77-13-4]EEU46605.1 hypothetical protein NECHADRAFT_79369 [Fusarium vanettenii 77-13-4]